MSKDLIEMAQGGAVIELTPQDRAMMGLDDLDKEDMAMPRLRMVQPTSTSFNDAQPGTIHNSITGVAVKEFTAVVLRVSRGRVCWPEKYRSGEDPLCASDDGLLPRQEYSNVYDHGQGCTACSMAEWGPNGEPPKCNLAYNYLVLVIDTEMPGVISMTRTSVKTAKQLNTLVSTYNIKHAIRFYASDKITGETGAWYEWRVADAGPVENPDRFIRAARNLAGSKITTDTEHDGNGSSGKGKSGDANMDGVPF